MLSKIQTCYLSSEFQWAEINAPVRGMPCYHLVGAGWAAQSSSCNSHIKSNQWKWKEGAEHRVHRQFKPSVWFAKTDSGCDFHETNDRQF